MGNTVLTYLRKAQHPNRVLDIKKCGVKKWFNHWTSPGLVSGGTGFTARKVENDDGIYLEFAFAFKEAKDWYIFYIYETKFSFRRNIKTLEQPTNLFSMTRVADIENIDYNEIESVVFQNSLISDLGMFGLQEAAELVKIRNEYFGENV